MTDSKPRANSYEDDDFRTVLSELDEMDDEAEAIMASARGKVSAIRKRQSNRIKIADKELQIPPALIRAVRAQRKLEKKIAGIAETLPDDLVELYVDAAGQFSFIEPDEDHPGESAAQVAARQRQAEIQAVTDKEQEEGGKALDELAGGQVH
jgi:hypothetical protein